MTAVSEIRLHHGAGLRRGAALLLGLVAGLGAPAQVAEQPAVELPPMVIAETADAPPWLYVQVNGTEYLSRCSTTTTRLYAEHWERAMHGLWTMVPDWLVPRRELAGITIIYSQKLAQSSSPELLQSLKKSAATGGRPAGEFGVGDVFFRFAPNMRLNDRDGYVTFAYLDEMHFDPERMRVAPGYLRMVLERRVPALPPWFIHGMLEVYHSAAVERDTVKLDRRFWVDRIQNSALSLDAEHPRAVLPAAELFAHDALRGAVNGNSRRALTLEAQAALFIRWALETSPATREALWKFVARTAEEPPSDDVFTACFGFGYSELRDRLSDYIPRAIKEPGSFSIGRLPRIPRASVRHATSAEIARLRGEWERLAAVHVRPRSPELHARYVEQARATLRKAFDTGDRDPRLLAALGLCEIDAGSGFGARFFLEPAVAAGVARPRAHYELARLRYLELRQADPAKEFSANELAPVLGPVRTALQQRPPLPEAFALFADAWARCSATPPATDLALLETGAKLFARQTDATLTLALALAKHGRKEAAAKLLATGAEYGPDEATRKRFVQAQSTLGLSTGR